MLNKFVLVAIGLAVAWKVLGPQHSLTKDKLLKEYDYVIVGAGSAGAIVAARLSEDPEVTVALLEAGPDNDEFPEAAMPMSFLTLPQSDADWAYWTEPQEKGCKGLIGQKSPWTSGRALGGSSLINAMMAVRCSPHDYDLWAEMGNTGWSYEDVLPYFKKMETVTKDEWKSSGLRGTSGPITITEPNSLPEASAAFIEAAKTQGFINKDTNGDGMVNRVTPFQGNINTKGVRQSTAVSYLKPAMTRPNLHVLTEAHVTKVLFDGDRAVGVEYMHRGHVFVVRARIEVILSAGSVGSAKLLMLSGVGPRKHLETMNIPVVANLPVGENLYDHVQIDAVSVMLEKPVALVVDRIGLMDLLQYKLFGKGVLGDIGLIGTAFSKSKHQPAEHNNPYLQYIAYAALFNDKDGFAKRDFNYKPEVHEALYGGLEGKDGIVILTALLQPQSVGSIRLRSANPFEQAIIDPQYLTDQQDVDILIEGIRITQKIMTSPPLTDKLGAKLLNRVHPNCVNETFDSDEYWECYIRSNTMTIYHPVSTCRMGPDSDPNSVVDPQLRVHGIGGLRVVDASIMPRITSGNTNFPTMMIAEKASDTIKNSRREKH